MRWRIHHKIIDQPDEPNEAVREKVAAAEWQMDVDRKNLKDIEAVEAWFKRFKHLKLLRVENLDVPVTVAPIHDEGERRAMGAAAEVSARAKK